MMLPVAAVMILLVLAVQLALCFCAKRRWVKAIPLYLIGAGELACAAGYFFFDHIYGAVFAAVIYAVVLLIALFGDALAWLICYIVKTYKTRNKTL